MSFRFSKVESIHHRKLISLGFRRLHYDDEDIFRNFFRKYKENKSYASSWLYITQAARGLGKLGYVYLVLPLCGLLLMFYSLLFVAEINRKMTRGEG